MSGPVIARRIALSVAFVAVVLASPVAVLLGVAAWQHYAPGSLRTVISQVSAVTEPGYVDAVLGVAVEGRAPGHPG